MERVLVETAQALMDEASDPAFTAEDGKLVIRFARGATITVEATDYTGLSYGIEKGDG